MFEADSGCVLQSVRVCGKLICMLSITFFSSESSSPETVPSYFFSNRVFHMKYRCYNNVIISRLDLIFPPEYLPNFSRCAHASCLLGTVVGNSADTTRRPGLGHPGVCKGSDAVFPKLNHKRCMSALAPAPVKWGTALQCASGFLGLP